MHIKKQINTTPTQHFTYSNDAHSASHLGNTNPWTTLTLTVTYISTVQYVKAYNILLNEVRASQLAWASVASLIYRKTSTWSIPQQGSTLLFEPCMRSTTQLGMHSCCAMGLKMSDTFI